MSSRTNLTLLITLILAFALSASALQNPSDRAQDGLSGPVRRVKTEVAKITTKNGKPAEGPRVLLETATYDIKGAKVDNAYFLAAAGSTLTGREVYKYDDKGNIVEMTMHNDDGSLLSKEIYAYEFDALGNWTKMITSVAVMEGGKLSFEPTEVTYRTFSYFVDEATLAKMSQPAAPAASNNSAPAANTSSSPVPADNKSAAAASKAAEDKSVKGASKMAALPLPVAVTDKAASSVSVPVSSVGVGSSSGAPVVNSDVEAPERAVARGPVKPISGGILNGRAIKLPAPAYPDMAKRARASGMVTVEVVIDVTGRVISASATNGHAMLRQAAEQAAKQARFSPTLLSGQPVRVSGQITYNFSLN